MVYPDPLKPSGIEFELPDEARVSLTLFDSEGRELKKLIDTEILKAGTHAVDFVVHGYANGVYLYRLSIERDGERFVDAKRIVIGTADGRQRQV